MILFGRRKRIAPVTRIENWMAYTDEVLRERKIESQKPFDQRFSEIRDLIENAMQHAKGNARARSNRADALSHRIIQIIQEARAVERTGTS